MENARQLPQGHQIGPYRITKRLGEGATATVYQCIDDSGDSFAIKVRQRGITLADRRFVREFEALRSLRLPGVVRVFEAGIEPHLIWFSMEEVRGPTLLEFIHQATQVPDRVAHVLDLGQQLMGTLARLHNAGFVHRDVKPSNVLVDETGAVRVLDFGISRYFEPKEEATNPGLVVGTMRYMAPEQFAGLPVTDKLDVFAAGLILYEAINGLRPGPKLSLGWIPLTTLDRLPALATLHREVPKALSHLIETMLNIVPTTRPSCAEAADSLSQMGLGDDQGDWPEPAWTDIGSWWGPLEDLFGSGQRARVFVLDGPSGSGRRRIAEQLHRHALLQGVWTLHGHCNVTVVGGPLKPVLDQLLREGEDEAWCQSILAADGLLLTTLVPDLPIQSTLNPVDDTQPTIQDIASAVGRTLQRASTRKQLLLVVHQLEQVDPVTAATVQWILDHESDRLGLLLIHDDRWASAQSQRLVRAVDKKGAERVLRIPPLKPRMAHEIVRSLCPSVPVIQDQTGSPQRAVERGLQQLARWRQEDWSPAPPALWPFAVSDLPLPAEVVESVASTQEAIGSWVSVQTGGLLLRHQGVRRAIKSRLADRRRSAGLIAKVWASRPLSGQHRESIATFHLLAGQVEDAWPWVLASALKATELGQYAKARSWLLLLDTLPFPTGVPQSKAFSLTLARARVALITDQSTPRRALLQHCETLAKRPVEIQRVGVLLAQHLLRRGEIRSGLVTALRCASPSVGPDPAIAVTALAVATRCRLLLNQPTEAQEQLSRAHRLLEEHPDPGLSSEILRLEAQVSLRQGLVAEAQTMSEAAKTYARLHQNLWSQACAAQMSSEVNRLLGQRRRAERDIRFARNALGQSGDIALLTHATLQLATLLVERGDIIGARKYFSQSIRRVRRLGLPQAKPLAMKLQLDVATAMSQPDEAETAIAYFESVGYSFDEAPASAVRFWRTQRQPEAALQVSPPPHSHSWGQLLWRLERAFTALVHEDINTANMELHAAERHPNLELFVELKTYWALLSAFSTEGSPRSWRRNLSAATKSLYLPLVMAGLELNARRFEAAGKAAAARSQWTTLYARAEELGYRPAVELAQSRLSKR
jgi:tetratricopeptide (TPR) repeat protein